MRLSRFALAAPLVLALGAGPASAISISGVTIVKNAGNTADSVSPDARSNKSVVAVLDSGGSVADTVGATVDAKTRYSMVNAQAWGFGNTGPWVANADYTVTFTVDCLLCDVTIDTSLLGSIALQDDSNGGARADMSAIAGSLDSVTNAALGIADPGGFTGTHNGSPPQGDDSVTDFVDIASSSTGLTLLGVSGTSTYTLRFTWTTSVQGIETGFFSGTDDSGVRLGEDGGDLGAPDLDGAGCSVCNYQAGGNFGNRIKANDGHFVTIRATSLVPEPGTVLLLGSGLAGLAVRGRKRA